MELIEVSKVIIPSNRIRQEFDEDYISSLANSIKELGLMNAITLRDDGTTLIAGENRLRAISQLKHYRHNGETVPQGYIPFVRLSQLDPYKIREAELEENIRRKDLTWQEQAWAKAELHKLRLEQTQGTQTITATANEISGRNDKGGTHVTELSDSLLVSKHMHDPDVAKAPTLKEAKKILTRKLEDKFRQALMDQHGVDISASPHALVQGDCLLELDTVTYAAEFDCVIVDPPYFIGADNFGTQATTVHNYKDSQDAGRDFYTELAHALFTCTKDQAHVYLFCDPRWFPYIETEFEAVGFDVWPTPLIWDKSGGMLPEPTFGPRRTYEMILFANKGRKTVTGVYNDILRYPSVNDKTHAAEKPLDLYVDLLRRSCVPGDRVLDCCCGSGVIFPAATKLSLIATGIEKDQTNFNIASLRRTATE